MLTLKGSILCVQGALTATALHLLAGWARKLGSITINDQELTAEDLEDMARQSECAGEPLWFKNASDRGSSPGSRESRATDPYRR
jgi:hypothetical protein